MLKLDVDASSDASEAISLLKQHKLLVVRHAMDPAHVSRLCQEVRAAFAALDTARPALSEEDCRLLDRMEMPVPAGGGAFRLRLENYGVLASPRVQEILEGVAGPFLWHYPPMIRRQTPTDKDAPLPFHQDWSYTRHYPRFFTCWTTLTPCGVDAPGLELIAGPTEEFDHQRAGVWEQGLPLEEVTSLAAERGTMIPDLAPGDVVLFSEHTLHRTHVTPAMTHVRYSIDFRAAPLSAISPDVRARRKFVDPKEIVHV